MARDVGADDLRERVGPERRRDLREVLGERLDDPRTYMPA
jgi:hypothetical protein